MKKDIHPTYEECVITCSCGNTWTTRGTRKELKIEHCSLCHPIFTGKDILVDTAGQVDKFQKKIAAAQERQAALAQKMTKKREKKKAAEEAAAADAEE